MHLQRVRSNLQATVSCIVTAVCRFSRQLTSCFSSGLFVNNFTYTIYYYIPRFLFFPTVSFRLKIEELRKPKMCQRVARENQDSSVLSLQMNKLNKFVCSLIADLNNWKLLKISKFLGGCHTNKKDFIRLELFY